MCEQGRNWGYMEKANMEVWKDKRGMTGVMLEGKGVTAGKRGRMQGGD